jgi:hypothetical protein
MVTAAYVILLAGFVAGTVWACFGCSPPMSRSQSMVKDRTMLGGEPPQSAPWLVSRQARLSPEGLGG